MDRWSIIECCWPGDPARSIVLEGHGEFKLGREESGKTVGHDLKRGRPRAVPNAGVYCRMTNGRYTQWSNTMVEGSMMMVRVFVAEPYAFVAVTVMLLVPVVNQVKLNVSLVPRPVCLTGDCPAVCHV